MATETVAQQQTMLAFATQPCTQTHSGRGSDGPPECCYGEPVYVLGSGVREDCDCGEHKPRGYLAPCRPACKCQGRGQVTATDGWAWWRAANESGIHLTLYSRPKWDCWHGSPELFKVRGELGRSIDLALNDDPEAAFFAALYQAVDQITGRQWPEVGR